MKTATCSTSAARRAGLRRPSDARWTRATRSASGPAATPATFRRITSRSGPKAARPGSTTLCNLCHYHHHFVHDGDYRIEILPRGELRFTHPGGWEIPSVPEPVEPPNAPLTELMLDEDTGRAGWNGERVNVEALVDATRRLANEASPTRAHG